jgi:hypothetical protein
MEYGSPIQSYLRLTDRKFQHILPAVYDLIDACIFRDVACGMEILQITNELKILGVELTLIHKSAGEHRNSYLLNWYSYKLLYVMNTIEEIHRSHSSGKEYISSFDFSLSEKMKIAKKSSI